MAESDSNVWLITGGAGFIGSHLVETLLHKGESVVAVDNFVTGSKKNVELMKNVAELSTSGRVDFRELDVTDRAAVQDLFSEVCPTYVLHQAALGSVPRSIENPIRSHEANVDGFISVLEAARIARVRRFVYASSSSVYGDSVESPKREEVIGECLSPYAATKRVNEIYAQVYGRTYGVETVGLRYFNVFGPRQDPNGPYAAVIPRWLAALKKRESVTIFGDGSTSRDFCYVKNVVQANLLAATVASSNLIGNDVINIACGNTTSLLELEFMLRSAVAVSLGIEPTDIPSPVFEDFRKGDIKHSLAAIDRASMALQYAPTHSVGDGIRELVQYEF
jgi:UDP-N-acetylglucosamine 4-epimerase